MDGWVCKAVLDDLTGGNTSTASARRELSYKNNHTVSVGELCCLATSLPPPSSLLLCPPMHGPQQVHPRYHILYIWSRRIDYAQISHRHDTTKPESDDRSTNNMPSNPGLARGRTFINAHSHTQSSNRSNEPTTIC